MIRLILLFLLALSPGLATANPVVVQSGEHDGFTRLVFNYGQTVDWQMGRSADGYELQVARDSVYDFTEVFDLIGKGRLAAIWSDPATGALRIGVACACHAIPFEFRPGIIVVDLRDGPPPKGSSFELALDGSTPVLTQKSAPRPSARPTTSGGYDWLRQTAEKPETPNPFQPQQRVTIDADPTLQPLRDALLRQISRGAAQGVVDMAKPASPAGSGNGSGNPSVQIRVGDLPGVTSSTADEREALAADGKICPSGTELDLASWGDDRPFSEQLPEAMHGLIGEFDKPDPGVVTKAVKFHLFMGFGAEARQLLTAFPTGSGSAPLWRSLSYLLDAEPDPAPAFTGLAACDSAASLWAMLSDPPPAKGEPVNQNAALLAFSALPIHQRNLLGPALAERFLARGDDAAARAIRDAILRSPDASAVETDLLQASMDMQAGDPAAAQVTLESVLADPGPHATEAMIAYVEARVAQSLPVEPDIVPALEAMVLEQSGTPLQPAVERALILAQAASGDFKSALAAVPDQPETESEIWRVLAFVGVDAAILEHAILPDEQARPNLPADVTEAIVRRLQTLGFAQDAARWIDGLATPDVILAASVALAQGDARAALTWLAGSSDPAAQSLRAAALDQLGDADGAAKAFAASGAEDQAVASMIRARDWDQLKTTAPDPWKAAIATVLPPADPALIPEGPLAKSQSLIEDSTTTRQTLMALLDSVPAP